MAHLVIAFGPNDSYFWQSDTKWAWRGLPASLASKFNVSAGDQRITFVYEMALGVNGSFYVGFRAKDGKIYSWWHGLPAGLTAWLGNNVHPDTVRVALGPSNASYWVSNTATGAYVSLGLPKDLSSALTTMRPKFLSLGLAHTYVMVATAGGAAWSLGQLYPDLDKQMDMVRTGGAGAFNRVHHISLGAFKPQPAPGGDDDKYYVIFFQNGDYCGTVPDGTEADISKVMESAKARVTASATPGAQNARRRSAMPSTKNVGGFLRLANSGLKLANALAGGAAVQQASNSAGPSFDTSAFTAGLQQDTWSTTQSVAQDPIQ